MTDSTKMVANDSDLIKEIESKKEFGIPSLEDIELIDRVLSETQDEGSQNNQRSN